MCHNNVEWLHHVLGIMAEQNKGRNQILVGKVKRQFEKSNDSFAWWRESRKPTWGGVPLPPPAGQGGRLGGGLPPLGRRPPTYKRRGRGAPLDTHLSPPNPNPSRRPPSRRCRPRVSS